MDSSSSYSSSSSSSNPSAEVREEDEPSYMQKRLANEAKSLTDRAKEENGILKYEPYEDTHCFWTCAFKGPKDTPLADLVYEIRAFFPENYPFEPPEIFFVGDVYHPNVDEKTGKVDLNILKPESWSPTTTLVKVVKILRDILAWPRVPLNAHATMMYWVDRDLYFRAVVERRTKKEKAIDEEKESQENQ